MEIDKHIFEKYDKCTLYYERFNYKVIWKEQPILYNIQKLNSN